MVQLCLFYVDPWGDRRADLRAAINTVRSMRIENESDRCAEFEALCEYVADEDENDLYDEDALAAVRDG